LKVKREFHTLTRDEIRDSFVDAAARLIGAGVDPLAVLFGLSGAGETLLARASVRDSQDWSGDGKIDRT
jgi:hypothetical protein